MSNRFFSQNCVRCHQVLFFLIICGLLSSCVGLKPGASKSTNKLFETFFLGEKGIQYFIKPLAYSNSATKEEVFIDFTFRHKDEIKDSATVNFTLLSSTAFREVDNLMLINDAQRVEASDISLIFIENYKKGFRSRFTTKVPLSKLKALFEGGVWDIKLKKGNNQDSYFPNKKTAKSLGEIKATLFALF